MKLKLTIVVAAVLSVCSCFARGRGPEHHHGGGGGSAHHSSHCGPRSARHYGHHHGWHGRPHYGWHGKPHHGWHGGCHRYHSGSYWYGGGDYLWPEIVGGVVGGALYEAVTYPAETVVVEERPAVITPTDDNSAARCCRTISRFGGADSCWADSAGGGGRTTQTT